MQFSAKKDAGCPKAPRDFPPRKDGILQPLSGCPGTPLLLPQSLYGRAGVRAIGYQIYFAMVLRWRTARGLRYE